jgi:hypothetical protein
MASVVNKLYNKGNNFYSLNIFKVKTSNKASPEIDIVLVGEDHEIKPKSSSVLDIIDLMSEIKYKDNKPDIYLELKTQIPDELGTYKGKVSSKKYQQPVKNKQSYISLLKRHKYGYIGVECREELFMDSALRFYFKDNIVFSEGTNYVSKRRSNIDPLNFVWKLYDFVITFDLEKCKKLEEPLLSYYIGFSDIFTKHNKFIKTVQSRKAAKSRNGTNKRPNVAKNKTRRRKIYNNPFKKYTLASLCEYMIRLVPNPEIRARITQFFKSDVQIQNLENKIQISNALELHEIDGHNYTLYLETNQEGEKFNLTFVGAFLVDLLTICYLETNIARGVSAFVGLGSDHSRVISEYLRFCEYEETMTYSFDEKKPKLAENILSTQILEKLLTVEQYQELLSKHPELAEIRDDAVSEMEASSETLGSINLSEYSSSNSSGADKK